MPVTIPQWANEDGRALASAADANVTVWPYTKNGEYDTNQRPTATRATTVTAGPDCGTGMTVGVGWNGVWYWWQAGVSVTIPATLYTLLTLTGSQYVVT